MQEQILFRVPAEVQKNWPTRYTLEKMEGLMSSFAIAMSISLAGFLTLVVLCLLKIMKRDS